MGNLEMKAIEKLLLPPVILKSVTTRRYAVITLMDINQFRLVGHVDRPKYLAGCAALSTYTKTTAGKIHIRNFNRLEYTARKVREAIDSSTAQNNVQRSVQKRKNAIRNKVNCKYLFRWLTM